MLFTTLLTVACGVAGFVHIRAFEEIVAFSNLGGSVEGIWKTALEKITLGLYDGADDRAAALTLAKQRLDASGWVMCGGFWALCAIGLWPAWTALQRSRPPTARARRMLLVLGWSSLILGVMLPSVLLINTQQTFLGSFMGEGQAKSIVSAVWGAFVAGLWVLAIVVLCVSLVVPLVKLVLLEVAAAADAAGERDGRPHRLVELAGHLKKSSVVEITVAALFILLFATKSISGTQAEAGWGVYFYCVHIAATWCAARAIQRRVHHRDSEARSRIEKIEEGDVRAAAD